MDEVHAFVQHTVPGKIPALHLRHDHICHEQVDLPLVFPGQTAGQSRILPVQDLSDQFSDILLGQGLEGISLDS